MCESRTCDALQASKFYKSASIYKSYYSISFNSAPSVSHYQLAEIWFWQAPDLNVASKYIWQVGVKFVLEACKLSIVHWIISITYIMHVNTIGEPLKSFLYFWSTRCHKKWPSTMWFMDHNLRFSNAQFELKNTTWSSENFRYERKCMYIHMV